MSSRAALLTLGAAAMLLAAGCGGDGRPAMSYKASFQAQGMSFQTDVGTPDQRFLDLGGLTLNGSCRSIGGQALLRVNAKTAVPDAIISSSFAEADTNVAFTFVMSDFDPSFGAYDFLGDSPSDRVGTLNYSAPDGSQVSVEFVAAQDTAQGECFFGGTAISTPKIHGDSSCCRN